MIQLSEKDFKFSVNNKPRVSNRNTVGKYGLLFFGVSWCGYCVKAKPEFKASAEVLEGKNIFYATIDGDKNNSLLEKLNIKGFPTILFVDKKGYIADVYQGEREKYAINMYMCVRTRQCRI